MIVKLNLSMGKVVTIIYQTIFDNHLLSLDYRIEPKNLLI